MPIKAALSKPYSRWAMRRIRKWSTNAVASQHKILHYLINKAEKTQFGKDHNFSQIKDYQDFKKQVPLRDYEGLKKYIDPMVAGEKDILWPGKPLYLSKTSGTTSGVKYIPISNDSMPNHIGAAKNALLAYIAETSNADFVKGKMIFLQGSPELETKNGIAVGRLSGIVAHHVPKYLQKNRLPSYKTNCIDDWETKVDAIVEETKDKNLTLISGIPSWVQMYFERLLQKTGKATVHDVFPNFSLFVYGGVNFEPYRKNFEQLIGRAIPSVEVYPASEGFIAYQDSQTHPGLLLNVNSGIFFEFVKAEEIFDENPTRVDLNDVELDVNYAIILNTNAGLWGYNIGDTVKFVSLDPYRIVVTGRIKHFTSAFGEHVISEEVEYAMKSVLEESNAEVAEFHVAPHVSPGNDELPYHEWFVEFNTLPHDFEFFRSELDRYLQEKNIYYYDLIKGKVLQPLKVRPLDKGAFHAYMKKEGKLGGQNKIPRLSNDRKIAEVLKEYQLVKA